MVFSTTNLFKHIKCPEGDRCRLTSCIYGHDLPNTNVEGSVSLPKGPTVPESKQTSAETVEPASKRRRVIYDTLASKPPSRADQIRNELASARTGTATTSQTPAAARKPALTSNVTKALPSLEKTISPPTPPKKPATAGLKPPSVGSDKHFLNGHSASPGSIRPAIPKVQEALNPRLIPNDPAGHTKRAIYLKHLHGEMQRLTKSGDSKGPSHFPVDNSTLVVLALDEEEKIAREQPTLYANVVKNRIAALKKMTYDEWVKYAQERLSKDEIKPVEKIDKPIDTTLTTDEELALLPKLVIDDQKPLAAHGYIPFPPTAEQAAEAAAAVEASKHYEICDRCSARFQVFPDRDEEGRLTSGGSCQFHPLRKAFPQRSKTDRETGPKEPYFPCCHQNVGAQGCTTHTNHVFKTNSAARLAATVPFIDTPVNSHPAADVRGNVPKAVTFDCEMGYTTDGMELIRLTAVTWPGNAALLDILVRPRGAVLDLNSRFSGVFPEHYQNAVPYGQWKAATLAGTAETGNNVLPIVESPQKARELLCSFLTPDTPLIGHAIENDLNATRLCHPTIVDTILLFPHPRGLPMRNGLKMLSQKMLGRFIQTGGERGHDSLEDAVATGDLVRVKAGNIWKKLQLQGWKFVDGRPVGPPPSSPIVGNAQGKKRRRKRHGMDGTDESTEDEEVKPAE